MKEDPDYGKKLAAERDPEHQTKVMRLVQPGETDPGKDP